MALSSPADHLNEKALAHAHQNFVQVAAGETVETALAWVRSNRPGGRIVYFYVVDDQKRLVGVLPTRRLLLSQPETAISELMIPNVVALPADATLLDACEQFILHRFLALPIVDDERKILGVADVELYTDEMSDLIRQEEGEDIFQLIGVRLEQIQQAGLGIVFTRRFPWLLCNIGGGLACAVLASRFESILNQVIVLSLFIPIVLAVAESVSIQTLSLALQARPTNRFHWRNSLRGFAREVPVGLMLGIACGGMVALVVLVWKQAPLVALVILLAMSLAVTTAATLGLLVPTILHTAQRDPKVASGPIALALTDLATLFYYLGLATLLLA